MKKIYSFLFFLCHLSFGQAIIYSENFGNPSTSPSTISGYTFQNSSPISYSGSADIRNSTPSTGYPNSSGNGCVFIGATTANPVKQLLISGIDTQNYDGLTLSLGHYKGTNAGNNELTIEVGDGITWSTLTYTRPTGTGTSTWLNITPTGVIPSISNLNIRITNPLNSNVGFRIDDIKLTGNLLSSKNFGNISGLKVFPVPAKNILNVTSDSFATKNVEVYNMLGAKVLTGEVVNGTVNISSLTRGIYVIKITEEGKTATRELVVE
ncbi:MAG: T9SS type A sorting domain-containing protein [Limnohabitans sp.]|nr:T9SS type A sorting domain-containing protein [Limnohabitans sp.]